MSRYKKSLTEIRNIMRNPSLIRNVGIVAHIDHGKTTLTDSLLSAAGYISPQLAGSLRALDYLEEEQNRGITIKSANISLVHSYANTQYLINLVDTPGHVDFTGNVTRALRLIDGVVVVVDAVEEIMAQTETVTRQAMSEYIKPILFINKIDRLINELKLSKSEISSKLQRILLEFNNLIETYAQEKFMLSWKVKSTDASVAYGSATDRWGFNYGILSAKKLKFDFILQKYANHEQEQLQKLLPVHEPVFQGMILNLPSPVESQNYRIKKIWPGDVASEIGKAILKCDSRSPPVLFASKVDYDPKTKFTVTTRIYAGTVKRGDELIFLSDNTAHVANQIFLWMGASHIQIPQAEAGNIIGLSGLDKIVEGETMVGKGLENGMLPFERVSYVSDPVITISVEPVKFNKLQEFLDALELLAIQDPTLKVSINTETGEYLLSGVGELHLEITIKKLKELGIDVVTSDPIVVFRETITKDVEVSKKGPTTIEEVILRLTQTPTELRSFLEKRGPIEKSSADSMQKLLKLLKHKFNKNILYIFENGNILVVDPALVFPEKVREALIEILKNKFRNGPLCEEPIWSVEVDIKRIVASMDKLNVAELASLLSEAFDEAFRLSSPLILEPIFKIQITTPKDYVGKIVSILSQRKCQIKNIKEIKNNSVITGLLPVRESFGLSMEIRKVSSGRAFWQTQFYKWDAIPKNEQDVIVQQIRSRKGLK